MLETEVDSRKREARSAENLEREPDEEATLMMRPVGLRRGRRARVAFRVP